MGRSKKSRVLWCKKALVKPASGTLQKMLTRALAHKSLAKDRSEPTSGDPNSKSFRLIAQHYPISRGGIAGIFTAYEPGSSAVSLENDPNAKQISFAQLQPPKTQDGKRREWAEGLLYFYVRDDYVVLIQSSAVRQEQFEEHLSWLLKDAHENLGPAIALTNRPTKRAREMVQHSHVKSVNFGGPLMQVMPQSEPTGSRHHHVKVVGKMLDIMREALKSGDESFRWEEGLDGNLEAWLHLTYKRNTHESAQQLLDRIGLAMRNVEGIETELELGNGETLKGDNLSLKTKRQILADDGVLVADNAFSEMVEWFTELAETGHLG